MRKLFDFTKAAFWVGLIFALYIFAILTNETSKNYTLRAKSEELETQIEQLQSQIEEQGYRVTYYKTNAFQDRLAREKLGMQKPGESVVIIQKTASPDSTVQGKTTSASQQSTTDTKPHWQQWREFLFG